MGRKSSTRELAIWINGIHAANWRFSQRGTSELLYSQEWVNSSEGRPLSLSLPFSLDKSPIKTPAVENYFENLLPDSDVIRQRIKDKFNTPSRNTFDLLAAIGRDCVGATQLLPPDGTPPDTKRIDAKPLGTKEVEKALVAATTSTPMRSLAGEDFRISIAGAQEKSAFLYHNDQWCAPTGSTPTTHIFKLPLGLIGGIRADMTLSVENEWLCAQILKAFHVPVANCEMQSFGHLRTLIVERFDRQLHSSGKYWLRLVQEDFCQATGVPSSRKYEADGGPGILEISKILRGSQRRDEDLRTFLKAQILFWLLAAGDGHAKNFSLRITNGGRYQLTPLYDVISYYPIMGEAHNKISSHDVKMAMAFRGKHYAFRQIQRRHMNETAMRSGYGKNAEDLIQELLEAIPTAVATVESEIPLEFPEYVASSILDGLRFAANKLKNMAP